VSDPFWRMGVWAGVRTAVAELRGGPPGPLDRVRAEQVAGLYRTGPLGIAGALVAAVVLTAALAQAGALGIRATLAFDGAVAVIAGVHLALCYRYRRLAPPADRWRPWARRFALASLAEGLFWGTISVSLTGRASLDEQLLVMLVTSAVGSGAVAAFGNLLSAFFAIFLPAILPFLVWCALRVDLLHGTLAVLTLIYIVAFAALAQRINAELVETLGVRFANLDLAVGLRRQKELAEQASQAKTRFLAAASHDLRQPLHALAMFAGALREAAALDDIRRLAEHIDASIGVMDLLLGALLDISRLDAGVVEVHPRAFVIQPMLERLLREHSGAAEARGLRLRLRTVAATVQTDPVLLERMLRNLLNNALRYTDRGGVLVAARRRGPNLLLQVIDTGRGIPAAEQERVFEEFYQLSNPERDRAKGLGLGLAIVRRMGGLLGCPVALRSVPGRGSVFSVLVPLAAAVPAEPAPLAPPPPAVRGALILVIDDDAAALTAVSVALRQWGHEVVTAATPAEMLERTARLRAVPDLLICDYRLPGETDGIRAIQALRGEFNEDIPAMLITGDTAPDRLREAQDSGILLLHKPVAYGRLRAAIGNLLRPRMAEGVEG
jgi:signal transduction histidine kinase/CheY-like chemotaxis protein